MFTVHFVGDRTISIVKAFRISILLLVLFFVFVTVNLNRLRATDWDEPLWVAVYPVNGDGRESTQRYIDSLPARERRLFTDVDRFLNTEISRYRDVDFKPAEFYLAPEVNSIPPVPPDSGSVLSIAFWSLRLRIWVWQSDTFELGSPDARIYMVYHDPDLVTEVRHSLGLKEGRIGVVNAFASHQLAARNNIVLVHELFHTLGAVDKYDPQTNYPLYPAGFAEPQKRPKVPQEWAEVMAGRTPVSAVSATMPNSLDQVVVGDATAAEIRWID